MATSDVAIIGISVEAPEVRGIRAFWDVISSGRSLDRDFPPERAALMRDYVRYMWDSACHGPDDRFVDFHHGYYLSRVDTFDAEFFGMTPKQAMTTDPHLRMIMRNIYLSLEDAGYLDGALRAVDTGIYVGYASTTTQTYQEYLNRVDTSLGQIAIASNLPSMMANRMSHFLDLHGPSMMVDTACSASLVAVHQARNALLVGDCEMAVVAGSRVALAPVRHPQHRLGIEASDGVTRTFDERADGTGYGEGSGALVLKPYDRAVADGDQIYAVIKGSAVNHDGRTEIMTSPDSGAQERLLLKAWRNAGIDPRTLGYIEAHGTATPVGDPTELDGLRAAFARHTDDLGFCAVGTVKANIGHLFEGSGVMGIIKSALVLHHRTIPRQANFEAPSSRLDFEHSPVYVPTATRHWEAGAEPRRCGVSAFGLGGANCHIVLEEYVPAGTAPARSTATAAGGTTAAGTRAGSTTAGSTTAGCGRYLFTLSAHQPSSLRRLASRYASLIADGGLDGTPLRDVCYTTNRSRAGHRHRLAFYVADLDELRTRLTGFAKGSVEPADGDADRTDGDPLHADGDGHAARYLRDGYLDLAALYPGDTPRPVTLPGYEFEEQSFWIDFPSTWEQTGRAAGSHPVTHRVDFEPAEVHDGTAAARTLALVDPAGSAETLLRAAGLENLRILRLAEQRPNGAGGERDGHDAGDGHDGTDGADGESTFRLAEDDFERIADLIIDGEYDQVVHALAVETEPAGDVEELDRRVRKNLYSLFQLGKALMAAGCQTNLAVLTHNAVAVWEGQGGVVAENASVVGLAKTINRESPYLRTRVVDIDAATTGAELGVELRQPEPGLFLLRRGQRMREVFRELPEMVPADDGPYLRDGGTYLVTGGTGAIGREVCRAFATAAENLNLVLFSRSGAPDRAEWDEIRAFRPDTREGRLVTAIQEIEKLGATVHVRPVDVGDPVALAAAVTAVRRDLGRLDGIVHAAGIPGENLIAFRELSDFEAVVRPKLHAAFVLDQLTRDDRPDFTVYFSSVAAVFPASGQGDYAAANYYLDNLARANDDERSHVIAFDWVAWRDIGMAAEYGTNMDTTFKALPTAVGISILQGGLASRERRVFAGAVHYEGELVQILKDYDIALEPAIRTKIDEASDAQRERLQAARERVRKEISEIQVELTGRDGGEYDETEFAVARCWAGALGLRRLDVNASFFELGGDSIMVIAMASKIATCLDLPFDAADVLADPTITAIARRVGEIRDRVSAEAELDDVDLCL